MKRNRSGVPLPAAPQMQDMAQGPLKICMRSPNRAYLPTQHKTFSRKINYVGTENIVTSVQIGNYIRPFTETECNGRQYPQGHLQEFDLLQFAKFAPAPLLTRVRQLARVKSVILYMFFHSWGERITVHGFAITEGRDKGYALLHHTVTGPTYKSWDVMDRVLPFISTKQTT